MMYLPHLLAVQDISVSFRHNIDHEMLSLSVSKANALHRHLNLNASSNGQSQIYFFFPKKKKYNSISFATFAQVSVTKKWPFHG